MTAYIALALRRNRLLFIGLLLCFAASLPFAVMLMRMTGHPGEDGLNCALVFWLLVGIPGAALLFGSSSGVSLRHESEQGAESPLPLPPRCRIVSACLAAGVHTLLLSSLVLLVAFILGKGWFPAPDKAETWIHAYPELYGFMVFITFAAAHLVITGFTLAYVIGNGILGGMLACAASLGPAVCLALMLALQGEYGWRAPFSPAGPSCILAAFVGALWALSAAPAWIERKARAPWFAVAAGLLAGVLGCGAGLSLQWDRLNRALSPVQEKAGNLDEYLPVERLIPEIGKTASQGMLLCSVRGELVWVTREGARTLIPAENRGLRDLIDHPWWRRVVSTEWDEDGSLWVLLQEDRLAGKDYQVWNGKPGEGFSLRTSFSAPAYTLYLVHKGRELGLRKWSEEGNVYAPLPGKGKAPQWRNVRDLHEFLAKAWEAEGRLARLSDHGKTLALGGRRWRIPGEAWAPGHNIDFETMEGRVFLIPYQSRQGTPAVAVCLPDGSVRTEWASSKKRGWIEFEVLPDGTVWSRLGRSLLALTPDGVFHPPMDLAQALDAVRKADMGTKMHLSQVELVKAGDDGLWLFFPSRETPSLLRIDAKDGRVLDTHQLPPMREMAYQATPDGILLYAGSKLIFFGFDGTKKELGRV
ncbi:MAG: hypothetical protein WC728_01420 [Elusimicrobiota bacterium]